jgi:SP family myo-inositol transporter-like MFS transporter 13
LKFAGIPDADVVYWSLIPAGTNAAGTVIGMFMVDRFGRRILLLLSLAGVIVTLLIMGVILLLSVTFSYVSPL